MSSPNRRMTRRPSEIEAETATPTDPPPITDFHPHHRPPPPRRPLRRSPPGPPSPQRVGAYRMPPGVLGAGFADAHDLGLMAENLCRVDRTSPSPSHPGFTAPIDPTFRSLMRALAGIGSTGFCRWLRWESKREPVDQDIDDCIGDDCIGDRVEGSFEGCSTCRGKTRAWRRRDEARACLARVAVSPRASSVPGSAGVSRNRLGRLAGWHGMMGTNESQQF